MLKRFLFVLLLGSFACQQEAKPVVNSVSEDTDSLQVVINTNPTDSLSATSHQPIKPIDTLAPFDGKFEVRETDKWTTITYPEFNLELNGEFWLSEEKRGDTFFLQEEVGEYIYGRELRILKLDSTYSLKAYLSLNEIIWQTYAYRPEDSLNQPDYETFRDGRHSYKNWTDDQFIPFDEKGSFIIPMLTEASYGRPRRELLEALNLDTTNYHIPGEMGGTHIYFYYQNKPAIYTIASCLFRFELHESNKEEPIIRYLQVHFSYGC